MNIVVKPFVSVIIPVFNDPERLKLCLELLTHQSYPKDCYEIIVINNASDDEHDLKTVVSQYQAIYTDENQPSSYAARNKGITLAKGEIIAFTDADCLPDNNWLEKGVSCLLSVPNCGLVAGKIEIFFQNPEQPAAIELYEKITAFPQEQLIKKYQGGATANIFTFKKVIDEVGMFNANLKARGDLEWGKRVFEKGYQQIYADNVIVLHPARNTLQQLYRRTIRQTGGIYDLYNQSSNSILKRNQMFIRHLGFNLMPPLMFTINTFSNPQVKTVNQKIKVILILILTRYIAVQELCRLKLGGISIRE